MLEIVAGIGAQVQQDVLQNTLGLRCILLLGKGRLEAWIIGAGQGDGLCVVPKLQELLWHLRHGHHQVNHPGVNGRARHAVELSLFGRLDQGDAPLLLDSRQTDRAIGAGAGKHHAKGALLVHIRQVPEEQIDSNVAARRPLRRSDRQVAVIHDQGMGRRNDVDAVFLDRDRLGHLAHRHFRHALNDPVGNAFMVWRQMKNDHEGHAIVIGHVFEERFHRVEAASGGANPDHRKCKVAGGQFLSLRNIG
ncbi:hypothetical protein D3C76_1138040 [compost metagenome]